MSASSLPPTATSQPASPATAQTSTSPAGYRYWAFISYSHDDGAHGAWLHRSLERYRVPRRLVARKTAIDTVPRRLFPVFRDREELAGSPDLTEPIHQALRESRFLVVICSPRAAASVWVNEEVRVFKMLRGEDRVLALIVDGEPNASDAPQRGLPECFPPAIRFRVDSAGQVTAERAEPMAADLRQGHDGRVNALLKLLAGLLGLPYDELKQRDRQHRRIRRIQLSLLSAAVLATIAGIWFGAAVPQQAMARSRDFASRAVQSLQQDQTRALVFALEAGRLAPTDEAVDALRQTLQAARLRTVFRHLRWYDPHAAYQLSQNVVYTVGFSPDGQRIVSSVADGTARVWDVETGEPIATLIGHDGSVVRAVFSSDGKAVATASTDSTARLWDLGNPVASRAILKGHTRRVNSAVFSPDGRLVVTASEDRTARLWDAASGALRAVLHASDNVNDVILRRTARDRMVIYEDEGPVMTAEFSPDSRWVVTASGDGTARIWNAATGAPGPIFRGHDDAINHALFSPDGRTVLTTSADGTARIWEAVTGRVRAVLRGHRGPLGLGAFSQPTGRWVVTTSNDSTARVWDAATGQALGTINDHTDMVTRASVSPDAHSVLTASHDGTARLLGDQASGFLQVVFRGHTGFVNDAAFSADNRWVVTAGVDGTARVWDASIDDRLVLRRHRGAVLAAIFSPDGRSVMTTSAEGNARVWATSSGALQFTISGHAQRAPSIAISRDGHRLLTVGYEGNIAVFDATTFALLDTLMTRRPYHHGVFSPDGRLAVTMNRDVPYAQLWDLQTHQLRGVLRHPFDIQDVAFSPDGKMIASINGGGGLFVHDAGSGRYLGQMRGYESPTRVVFSPDSRQLLTGHVDGTVIVWNDFATGEPGFVLRGHEDVVGSVAFSPDGRSIVTASLDSTARVWDVQSGRPRVALRGHAGPVYRATFSPDHRWIVTASADSTARLWDVSSGAAVTVFREHRGRVNDATFSPDSRWVVTAGDDFTARLFPTRFSYLVDLAESRLPASLTRAERDSIRRLVLNE